MSRPIIVLHPHFMKEGGASRVVLELTKRLAQQGHRIEIITQAAPEPVVAAHPELHFHVLGGPPTGSLSFWLRLPTFVAAMSKRIEEITPNPPLVFAHSLAIYWAWRYKVANPEAKTVYFFHDLGLPYIDSALEQAGMPWHFRAVARAVSPIFGWVRARVMRSGDHLIANSRVTAAFIRQHYQRDVDEIVVPGVDATLFAPDSKKEPVVYTLGRLEPIKYIDVIIRAFALAKDRLPSAARLMIIGEGSQRTELTSLINSLGLDKRVTLTGQRPIVDVAKLAAEARIGVFLCPNESFGLAAVETMSAGTPLVGTRLGGVGETVVDRKSGLLCELNAEDAAAKMVQLWQASNYDSYCQAARELTIKRYSWETSAEQLSQFFKKLKSDA